MEKSNLLCLKQLFSATTRITKEVYSPTNELISSCEEYNSILGDGSTASAVNGWFSKDSVLFATLKPFLKDSMLSNFINASSHNISKDYKRTVFDNYLFIDVYDKVSAFANALEIAFRSHCYYFQLNDRVKISKKVKYKLDTKYSLDLDIENNKSIYDSSFSRFTKLLLEEAVELVIRDNRSSDELIALLSNDGFAMYEKLALISILAIVPKDERFDDFKDDVHNKIIKAIYFIYFHKCEQHGTVLSVNHNEIEYRNEYINHIHEVLKNDNKKLLAITSPGGAGKTTVARALFQDAVLFQKYNDIFWINYSDDLDREIFKSSNWFKEIDDYKLRLKNIYEHFKSLQIKVLLIIDNVTEDINDAIYDGTSDSDSGSSRIFNLSVLRDISPYLDIIVTTRLTEIDGFSMETLPTFDEDTCINLFKYYNHSYNYNDEDTKYISHIISKTSKNPFLIRLLSKNLSTDTLSDYDALLDEIGFDCSTARISPFIQWKIGDLFQINNVDAIINPTDNVFGDVGSVSKQMYRKAGKDLKIECDSIGQIRTTSAVVTNGYNLNSKYIIHTSVPQYHRYPSNNPVDLLRNCYLSCFEIAVKKNIRTIAFPLIGSGKAGFPLNIDIKTCLEVASSFLEKHPNAFERVLFVLHDDDKFAEFSRIASEYNKSVMIRKIIDLNSIGDVYTEVLWDFALLNNANFTVDETKEWLNYTPTKFGVLKTLESRGYIDCIDSKFFMHDLIRTAVFQKLIPTNEIYDVLNLDNRNEYDYKVSYENNLTGFLPNGLKFADSLIPKSIELDSDNERVQSFILTLTKDGNNKYRKAISLFEAALSYCQLTNYQRGVLYHQYALIAEEFTNNDNFIKSCHLKALASINEAINCAENESESDVRKTQLLLRINSDYYYDYGVYLSSLGNDYYVQAERQLKRSLDYLDHSIGGYGKGYYSVCAQTYFERRVKISDQLGYILTLLNCSKEIEAKDYLERALSILETDTNISTDKLDSIMARVKDNLGYLLIHMDEDDRQYGQKLLSEAYFTRKNLLDSNCFEYLAEFVWTASNLGECYYYEDEIDLALSFYNEAIEYSEKLNKEKDGQYWHYLAWSKFGLALCYCRCGDKTKGTTLLNEAGEIYIDLAKRIDPSFMDDYEKVINLSIDENSRCFWYGNHAHFSSNINLIRSHGSR